LRAGGQDGVALLGRVLLSAIFLLSGYGKAMAPAGTMAAFRHLGVPLPGLVYAVALLVEIGGGLLILIGYRARPAGVMMAAWCMMTALIAHRHFQQHEQAANFMKNACMAGGFLQVAAFGAGRFSVDRT
jgi:putative oxidoreductase